MRATALVALSMVALNVPAQSWPASPIHIVVNFPAGGAVDAVARLVAQPLSDALHQPVVVENRGGANGNIGAETVARANPDGYTLLMSAGGVFAVNPSLYPNMSFDPDKDLEPVAAVMRVSLFLVGRNALPATNAREFIDYVRANPGKLSFASAGIGSLPHMAGEMFNSAVGSSSLHVPFRGAAPALAALLGGQVDYMFDPGISLAHVRSGKLRLFAVADAKRSALFPDAPTLAESGLDGFQTGSWYGLYAPAGVPKAVVTRLNHEINRILELPDVQARLQSLGGSAMPMSPAELREKARADAKLFGNLIREKSIKAN